jgi:Mg2+ and Co2+ transporter CorA
MPELNKNQIWWLIGACMAIFTVLATLIIEVTK